jgi:hypothetical protein
MIFADGSADALLSHEDVPGFGTVAITDVPAFVLKDGIDLHSFINFEFLPRPVRGSDPAERRLLWHWSGASQAIELAPNGESLTLISPFGEVSALPQQVPGPQYLSMTHLEPEDVGQHRHFMQFLLDDSPTAAVGAYGFFTRFLVAPYQPSDPLLVVFNNGLDGASLMMAARAINAAASEAVLPAGDFNSDGTVDAADYVLWRKGGAVPRTPQNYALWRANFDKTSGSGASISTAGVPEPGTYVLAAGALLAAVLRMPRLPRRFPVTTKRK